MMVVSLRDLDKSTSALVGGKAANLGELMKIDGINVPEGFCITTEAFKEGVDSDKVVEAINSHLAESGERVPYAVRSSSTAEDLFSASFAGQYDTYLNVVGRDAVFDHIKKCWASLFTERAVSYRRQNGFDDNNVAIAVIVQKMVRAEVSGVMFTSDPISLNRRVISIESTFGLGESLVSGHVIPDVYKVRNGTITEMKIVEHNRRTLDDDQLLELERIGRRIEKHFGSPQDIEWCLVNNTFYVVQSRPITTLFPVPETDDNENHVYVSVGHQQMMTDAMKPLGLSVRQLTGGRKMCVAGGRLFVDITADLAAPARRNMIVNVLGKSDPLIQGALKNILERDGFIVPASDQHDQPHNFQALDDYDVAVVDELIRNAELENEITKKNILGKSGAELIDFIIQDIKNLTKSISDPRTFGVIMTAMNAAHWINDKMKDWLGEKNVADIISQSVPNNITSQMGLDLLDVADVIRPYPEVIQYLQNLRNDDFMDGLRVLNGGQEVRQAIDMFLDKYGMRCAGEIDITRTRWSEKPSTLVPAILSNIKNLKPNEGTRKFEEGRKQALSKSNELLERLKTFTDGEQKVKETKRMIDLVRNLSGYREYPKYAMIVRYFIYKKALLNEAERLVKSGVIRDKEDIYYLTLEELRNIDGVEYSMIDRRKQEFNHFEKLAPPRVMTSEGEVVNGSYNRNDLPKTAIVGLAVSSGVVEGRARVISSIEDADFEEGDILVTSFTDPSWAPLFVSIKGLVTEVGGLMTHGAVIAREYGLPAVVGVENATKLIKDGERIRVNGTDGYVEVL